MNIWYVVNLVAAALLILWPVWFSRKVVRLRLMNPLSVQALVNTPFEIMKLFAGPMLLVDGGLGNSGFQYAVLMNNTLSLSQMLGTVVFFRCASHFRFDRYLPFKNVWLTKRDLRITSAFFLLIYCIAFLLLASATIGVIAWLANPRTGYQQYRVGQGHWYAIAISALSVASMASFLVKPTTFWILIKIFLFVGISYVLGTKGVMLYLFTAGIVMLSYLGRRQVLMTLVFAAPVVAALLVYNLFLALGDGFELTSLIEYFEYYKNAADYYSEVLKGSIPLFHGEVWFSSFWTYVPRAFYPDKPFVYGISHVNEIFFPGQAELTNTPAFGGAVEQFADFGPVGVVVLGFFSTQALLNGVLAYFLFRRPKLDVNQVSLGTFIALLMMAGPAFGLYFPGALYGMLVAVVTLSIGFLRRRRRTTHPLEDLREA